MVKPEISTFKVKFDFESQSQSPHKITGISNKVFCTSGRNLVILAWMGDELLRRQTSSSELGKIWL